MADTKEESSKLAKTILLVALVVAPASAVVFLKRHEVLGAVVSEIFVVVTAFIIKVWDKLEGEWVDRAAKLVRPEDRVTADALPRPLPAVHLPCRFRELPHVKYFINTADLVR